MTTGKNETCGLSAATEHCAATHELSKEQLDRVAGGAGGGAWSISSQSVLPYIEQHKEWGR